MLHHVRTALLVALLAAPAILRVGGNAEAAPAGCGGEPEAIVGSIAAIASSVRQEGSGASEPPSVSFLIRTDDARVGIVNVTLAGDAQVTGSDGGSTAPGEIPLSTRVRACGRYAGPMQFEATSIELLP